MSKLERYEKEQLNIDLDGTQNRKMPDRELIVNRPRILEIIDAMKTYNELSRIRRSAQELLNQVHDARDDHMNLFNIDSNGETIRLRSGFLLEELQKIIESRTIERCNYYIEHLQKGLLETRTNKINDLNLNRWREYRDIYTDSLWILDRRDSTGVHSADYWGNFIPQIPRQLMMRYTKQGEWVLDAFAGCGTSLIEAQRLGRNCIGVELQKSVADKARKLISSEPNDHNVVCEVHCGDSLSVDYPSLLKERGVSSIQLLIMHPPYFDIIKFSSDPRDLSNARSLDSFLSMLGQAVENAAAVLDKHRYFALVIGDKYSRGEWIPLGFLAMDKVLKQGFTLKSIIVKNFEETAGKRNQRELWHYRALVGGFYIFKHEYILLFRKK